MKSPEVTDRPVKSNGVKSWCERNEGWTHDSNAITKHYTFADADEAAKFAATSVRRAAKANVHLTLTIHGAEVGLTITPSGAEFTSNDLVAARRFDLKTH